MKKMRVTCPACGANWPLFIQGDDANPGIDPALKQKCHCGHAFTIGDLTQTAPDACPLCGGETGYSRDYTEVTRFFKRGMWRLGDLNAVRGHIATEKAIPGIAVKCQDCGKQVQRTGTTQWPFATDIRVNTDGPLGGKGGAE